MKRFLFSLFAIVLSGVLVASEPSFKLVGVDEPPILFPPLVGHCAPRATEPFAEQHKRATPAPVSIPPRTAGMHKHKCPYCNTVWEHGAASFGNRTAHTCPNCGRTLPHPWPHYNGPEAATFREGVSLTPRVQQRTEVVVPESIRSIITTPRRTTTNCPT